MLSELGASPSSNSGLVSSSTEPHLKLVIASVHLCNERRNGSERGLAQCTATWVAGALRQPQGLIGVTDTITENRCNSQRSMETS